ncbi:M16 family metallopeptidase [Clostridium cellulovorans]|uniref:Peptidase M16 domain protein n=1 Tax=Clostridium cellulovorans (strain ATCC 35296 / DSM 3052 / OCM 3 / 743B) TaxID=573061 RepID=D9SKP3_CLOC7|nr:pitrilysin family protein [Clostridium cellulovorans]ADL51539.1 peptidase M16 domain protein [Clostridium cellulovorans 743B]
MYTFFTIDNGLRVVLENIDHVSSVSVGLWVENGSRNETAESNGISHFIEHMLFKGTYNRNAKEIVEAIEDYGGQINAFTGKEATCYYTKTLDSHMERSFGVLSDMIFNSKFDPVDIEREKKVVIEEINMSEDSPEDVLSDLHSIAIWGDDPIALPILGTEETVKSFTREQLLEYIECRYIPENCVLSICGNIDFDVTTKLVNKYFGSWSSKNKKVTKHSTPIFQNKFLVKQKPIEQVHLSLGIKGIETGNRDNYPLHVINNVFGGTASSILFQKLREERGMCYSIYSYNSPYMNTGIMNVYAGLNPKDTKEAIIQIKNELSILVEKGISKETLNKTKEQLKGNYMLGLESTSNKMFANGKNALFLNRINTPKDIMKKINDITLEDINRVMKNTFGEGIINGALVGDNIDDDILKIF